MTMNSIYVGEPRDSKTDPRSPAYNGPVVSPECCCLIQVADGLIETANRIKSLAGHDDEKGAFLALASLREEAACITRANILSMMEDEE